MGSDVAKATASHASATMPTLLTAEDDAAMRRLLGWTLEDEGHEVVAFADGLMARRWVAGHRADRAPVNHAAGGGGG